MPRGDKEAIMKYDIEIPDKTVQHKIVTILDGISNKIELNTKINDNLLNVA